MIKRRRLRIGQQFNLNDFGDFLKFQLVNIFFLIVLGVTAYIVMLFSIPQTIIFIFLGIIGLVTLYFIGNMIYNIYVLHGRFNDKHWLDFM